jgi:GPH family glycoside/pentoside/hexuronide:cation symporter
MAYAAGAAGWSLADRIIVSFALFFYLPPEGMGLPSRLDNTVFLGLTVFGVIMIFGRVIDSIADPLVASWSDRNRSSMGRRRVFLAWGALPLAAVAALVFFPPIEGADVVNAVFLAVTLSAFFFLFTIYVTPYLALIPELARTLTDRINLTTLQAYASLLGAMIAMIAIPIMVDALGGGTPGYQIAIVITCTMGALIMLMPVFAVDERRFTRPGHGEQIGLLKSLRQTLSNKFFLYYLGGNIAYWFAFNIISSESLYFTTVLMQAEVGFQGAALTATFGVAAVFFAVWNMVARRIGKRRALLWAGASFVVSCGLFAFIQDRTTGVLAFALVGIPVGALLVLPNAVLADCTDYDARRTGSRREAMFFGVQGFLLKVNLGLSSALLAALMGWFGKDVGNDLGIRLSGPAAAAVVLLGMWSFWHYPEREVLEGEQGK